MIIILVFSILSFLLGLILSYTDYIFPVKTEALVNKVNDILPQSQCAQCGYSGCYPYAKAIINKNEKINKCVPGGDDLLIKMSKLLNLDKNSKDVNNHNASFVYTKVKIDEINCVGCSKCVLFCPVDAIIGAPNFVHTVIQNSCTGCNICILHCPTNCIKIVEE
nr:RnfABCDGE type electron transport complex subunit B [Buchnera aphidicola]